MSEREASPEFVRELQKALAHLYDPPELQRSPLVTLFDLAGQHSPASSLQRVLTDAIQALKPARDVPLDSGVWRIYHILAFRYIEQSNQRTVAESLALSVRQLRRQQRLAERALAGYLWDRYNLAKRATALPSSTTPGWAQELEWLRRSFPSETAPVAEIVEAVLRTAAPLAKAAGVQVACQLATDLPTVSGQLVALSQAFLNVLTAAIHATDGGEVCVDAEAAGATLSIRVCVTRSARPGWPHDSDLMERLHMARQCIELFGGGFEIAPVQAREQPFCAALTVPLAEQLPVLVVDDNADTLRLLQRYLIGTRYRFIGSTEADQVLSLAEKHAPRVIVVDIMLPGVDGWELLGRLRTHPKTCHLPIIVCTILPQEQLALTLGAAAFLRKPVSREALLAALDRQLGSLSRESP